MMLHPFAQDSLYVRMLALDTLEVEFFGKQSHAGMAPWNGINAVDAIMQGFDNMAMLRQQVLPSNRMHGIITDGGQAANVIPAHSAARLYARSVTRKQLEDLKIKMENCFKAAAKATGCTYKMSWGAKGPVEDVFMNTTLAEYYKELMERQGVKYLPRAEEEQIIGASTDMGNFSYAVPSIHPAFGIATTATNHTKEFADAAATEKAHELTLRAAKCLSLTAARVYLSEAFYKAAVVDFEKGKPE
ncbi:peptidase M20, dimerization domain-containing protein [Halteromyces radiatus]|nr:peptidase M20, dimerization domain-containing protein [Halteromyces radiatus]KAI8099217.1 peptidase M20, dimerization domain-containing protein [Halteromyces radiatus]